MFHYNKDSTTYGVARDVVPLFQDEDDNHLINELCIYILDKLSMFQYRFSKELLAYIEMSVAFSPYYRQDDPRTAGAMDTYFRDAHQKYADVTYTDIHDYLARQFHAWYAKFKPSSSAVVSARDSELGAVVQVEGVNGAAPPAKKPRYSLTLNDVSAAPAAAGPAAAVRPLRMQWRLVRTLLSQRTKQPALEDGGVIKL